VYVFSNSADFLKRKSFRNAFVFATGDRQLELVKLNSARQTLACALYHAWPSARAVPRAISSAPENHVFLHADGCLVGTSSAAFLVLLENLKCSTEAC